uniref:Uncharacterized protein n=1 Tax=Anguilla anguilla TaxID=7936 RepID=A0A0E9TZT2_ANGAN
MEIRSSQYRDHYNCRAL